MLIRTIFALMFLVPTMAVAAGVKAPPPDNCVGNAPCDWDDTTNAPTKDVNHRHIIPADFEPNWQVRSPGVIEMVGTSFTIRFDSTDLSYHLFWGERDIARDMHLYVVKEVALHRVRDLIRVGIEKP